MSDFTGFEPLRSGQCPACGALQREVVVGRFKVEHNGESREIADEQTVCGCCGSISYVGAQIAAHELAVAAAIRSIDGLLSAEELRRIRCKYSLRQTDLERMLSTGPKTWTRWERGKVPQSKTADKLIRLLADNASIVRMFMEAAQIVNPEATEAVAQAEADAKQAAWLSVRAEVRERTESCRAEEVVERAFERGYRAASDFRPLGVEAA